MSKSASSITPLACVTEEACPSVEDIVRMCDIIGRQTDYPREEIERKLADHQYQHMNVIKEYLGVPTGVQPSGCVSGSVHQEMYKQMRHKLDAATKAFNDKQNDQLQNDLHTK